MVEQAQEQESVEGKPEAEEEAPKPKARAKRGSIQELQAKKDREVAEARKAMSEAQAEREDLMSQLRSLQAHNKMLEEVSALLEAEERDTDIHTLLENAEYQIRFAEALGYGKRDREFEELYSAIKEIKQELKEEGDGDSAGLTEMLRNNLSAFKERISKPKDNHN